MFPTGRRDQDKYAYNDAGEMSEVKMLRVCPMKCVWLG